MSLEVRCTCGWRCQASEYYLGECIACPDCSAKIPVSARSDIPYGYEPYSTWQKKAPARAPKRRAPILPVEDPHAASALWLGIFAVMAALTGCGGVVAILLAAFGAREALRSNAFNRRVARPLQGRARVAIVLSSMAVLLAGISFFGLIAETAHHHRPSKSHIRTTTPQVEASQDVPQYRYRYTEAELREHQERLKLRRERQQAWNQPSGYKYGVEPQRTPAVPRGEFQEEQYQYSERVRQERAK